MSSSHILIRIDHRCSGFGNAEKFTWTVYRPFKASVYLHDYEESLDARCFLGMPALGDSRIVYPARYGVHRDTRIGTWIKEWVHRTGSDEDIRNNNSTWLDMQFLRCTEGRGYMVRRAKFMVQYTHGFSTFLP